jgi:hypothetical protein
MIYYLKKWPFEANVDSPRLEEVNASSLPLYFVKVIF